LKEAYFSLEVLWQHSKLYKPLQHNTVHMALIAAVEKSFGL